jgi:hypothetical protein
MGVRIVDGAIVIVFPREIGLPRFDLLQLRMELMYVSEFEITSKILAGSHQR